jgi:L-asparaginase II
MAGHVLAQVIRGETVESVHRGHLIVIDGEGRTVASLGDPETVTFFRSACKAFQALPFVSSGAAEALGFSDEEIALACASHSGEQRHVRIAQLMLDRSGLTEAHLRCGTHLPFSEKESERMLRAGEHPNQLHNNCSGKHAAMLALAKHLGADLATYDAFDHPVQAAILETVAQFAEVPAPSIEVAIDGCAAPNFALPVSSMARSFINLMDPSKFEDNVQAACRRIVSAMMKFPDLIGGSERLDTMVMEAAAGRVISKVGADGVWVCGVLPCGRWPAGLAIAMKVDDGDDRRARPVAAVEILRRLAILSEDDLPDVSPLLIKNRRGDVVGRTEAAQWIKDLVFAEVKG